LNPVREGIVEQTRLILVASNYVGKESVLKVRRLCGAGERGWKKSISNSKAKAKLLTDHC
jgi:hypothetical protein